MKKIILASLILISQYSLWAQERIAIDFNKIKSLPDVKLVRDLPKTSGLEFTLNHSRFISESNFIIISKSSKIDCCVKQSIIGFLINI